MARILIIDDSKTTRMVLRSALESAGHEIVGEATNGLEGYDMYFNLHPDLTTMDVTMPLVDGIACAEKIKTHDKDARILMISANAQAQVVVDAAALGIDKHITKPISPALLTNTINAMMSQAEHPE
ncbi:response regulator [Clostridia bacterium]|nr:response regulator [Clostridia bacterium]